MADATPNDLPQIKMTSTKKEMLEAYKAAKDRLVQQEKTMLDTEKVRTDLEKRVALAEAEKQSTLDPVHRIHDLRAGISRELTALAEKFEAEAEAFQRVQNAVGHKQDELKQLYAIETAAGDLAALIQAQQTRKTEFETQLEQRKRDMEAEINQVEDQWKQDKTAYEARLKEDKQLQEKQRQREQEEYSYALEREREQRRNALEDQLGVLEREIVQNKETFAQETAAKEKELQDREQAVSGIEEERAQLNAQVEGFPKELETKIKHAVDELRSRLESDYAQNEALLKAQFVGEKNVLLSRIEALQSLTDSQKQQLVELSQKQESAYEKVQSIASQAVTSAKHEIISIPGPPSGSVQTQPMHNPNQGH